MEGVGGHLSLGYNNTPRPSLPIEVTKQNGTLHTSSRRSVSPLTPQPYHFLLPLSTPTTFSHCFKCSPFCMAHYQCSNVSCIISVMFIIMSFFSIIIIIGSSTMIIRSLSSSPSLPSSSSSSSSWVIKVIPVV